MSLEAPSTMRPDEVALALVKLGIKKHNDRYESIFFKAVSIGNLSFASLPKH